MMNPGEENNSGSELENEWEKVTPEDVVAVQEEKKEYEEDEFGGLIDQALVLFDKQEDILADAAYAHIYPKYLTIFLIQKAFLFFIKDTSQERKTIWSDFLEKINQREFKKIDHFLLKNTQPLLNKWWVNVSKNQDAPSLSQETSFKNCVENTIFPVLKDLFGSSSQQLPGVAETLKSIEVHTYQDILILPSLLFFHRVYSDYILPQQLFAEVSTPAFEEKKKLLLEAIEKLAKVKLPSAEDELNNKKTLLILLDSILENLTTKGAGINSASKKILNGFFHPLTTCTATKLPSTIKLSFEELLVKIKEDIKTLDLALQFTEKNGNTPAFQSS